MDSIEIKSLLCWAMDFTNAVSGDIQLSTIKKCLTNKKNIHWSRKEFEAGYSRSRSEGRKWIHVLLFFIRNGSIRFVFVRKKTNLIDFLTGRLIFDEMSFDHFFGCRRFDDRLVLCFYLLWEITGTIGKLLYKYNLYLKLWEKLPRHNDPNPVEICQLPLKYFSILSN